MAYPATKVTFDSPVGTQFLNNPDHATNFNAVADTLEAVQDTLGTTGGTSVLKNFVGGDLAVRLSGDTFTGDVTISRGTISQFNVVGSGDANEFSKVNLNVTGSNNSWSMSHRKSASGELWLSYTPDQSNFYDSLKIKPLAPTNSLVVGTNSVQIGTLGTPTIVGAIAGTNIINTAAVVSHAITNGSTVFSKALATLEIAGTTMTSVTTAIGTYSSLGGDLLINLSETHYHTNAGAQTFNRLLIGTYQIPDAAGFQYFHNAANDHRQVSMTYYKTGIPAGVYVCQVQAATSAGTIKWDANDYSSLTILELIK